MDKEKPRWKDGEPYTRTMSQGEVEVQMSTLRLGWFKLTVIRGHTMNPSGFTGFVDQLDETYVLRSAKTLAEAKAALLGYVTAALQRVMDAIEEVEEAG